MKLTQTGWPRRFARSIVPPPTWGTTRGGAGWPTPNRPPVARVPTARREADAGRRGAGQRASAPAVGVAMAHRRDRVSPAATGSGAKARMPPSRAAAATTPASRPARMATRGDMTARRVPVRTGGGVPRGSALGWRSDVRSRRHRPHPDPARAADRDRGDPARGRAALVHDPGRCRAGRSPRRRRSPWSRPPSPTPSPLITLPPIGSAPPATPTASATAEGWPPACASPPWTSTCRSSRARPATRRAMSRCTSRSSASRARAGPRTSTPMPGPGMFLPLLETKGGDQKGLVVEVWTSDDLRYLYEIVEVRRNQTHAR